MPNEDNKILKYNYGEKSLKASFIIYADLECLLEKMHSCQNNPENFYTDKKTKHAPSGYSMTQQKTNLIVIKVKLYGKFLQRLERICNENNDL